MVVTKLSSGYEATGAESPDTQGMTEELLTSRLDFGTYYVASLFIMHLFNIQVREQ